MGGYVFGLLGRAPEQGDLIEEDGLRFKVVDLEGTRIERLEVEFLPGAERESGDEEERAAESG
jgi:putative hemolysin